MNNKPLKVLLDNGIFSHSEFAEPCIKEQENFLGDMRQTLDIHGFKRKVSYKSKEYQDQIDALFTVGRLINEKKIIAYDYIEILFERWRDFIKIPEFNAIKGCDILRCCSVLERSKFRSSVNFIDTVSKGGKKDRKSNVDLGEANQIAFFEWLNGLEKKYVDLFIQSASKIGLTDFEVISLKNLDWFKFLCQRSGSTENFPDIFHLWTAERNKFDVFLTLEKKLPNLLFSIKNENRQRVQIKTKVLRPLDLLHQLGIKNPDPVPMEKDRFYYFHEVRG
jgi:hypothetical protein